MKTRSTAFLAASLLALTVSQPGFAQEDSGAEQAEPNEAAAATEGTPAPEAEPKEKAAEANDSQKTEASADSADAEATDAKAGSDKAVTAETAETAEGESEEPKLGPGGKPLRHDYPGTEESKKARMDTDRIDGLAFEEGEGAEEVYDVRIRELETKVDDLKEKVFRSKSRIVLLKETVLSGNMSGSRAIVSHENDLGSTYVLSRAHYSLDGARVFNGKDKNGNLSDKEELELYNGSITPGNHRLSILLELKGSGYGVFSYMEGYKFKIKDSCDFKAQEGRSTLIKVRLIDRGGAMASYEERPGIECVVSSANLTSDDLDKKLEEGDGPKKKDETASKTEESASK